MMSEKMNEYLRITEPRNGRQQILIWCPGCEELHSPSILAPDSGDYSGPTWDWGHNTDPSVFTLSPSLLVGGVQWPEDHDFYKPTHAKVIAGEPIVCHSFIKNGQWEFLSDCTHHLVGQTVPLVRLPDYLQPSLLSGDYDE